MAHLKFENSQDFILKLQQRIHILLSLPLVFFIILFIKNENGNLHPQFFSNDFLYFMRTGMAVITLVVLLSAWLYFILNLRKTRTEPVLRNKLIIYYRVSLARYYLIESALIINLISLGLTADRIYAGFFGVALILFLMGYPSTLRIIDSLKLGQRDSEIILKREGIDQVRD